jgi:hypothetical protein
LIDGMTVMSNDPLNGRWRIVDVDPLGYCFDLVELGRSFRDATPAFFTSLLGPP